MILRGSHGQSHGQDWTQYDKVLDGTSVPQSEKAKRSIWLVVSTHLKKKSVSSKYIQVNVEQSCKIYRVD